MASELIKIVRGFVYNGAEVRQDLAIEDGAMAVIDESIPDSSDGLELTFALDVSEASAIVILCDAVVTIKTNSDDTPADTITTVANEMIEWIRAVDPVLDGAVEVTRCPFSEDVTALFVDNASGGAARLRIFAPYDPTPA